MNNKGVFFVIFLLVAAVSTITYFAGFVPSTKISQTCEIDTLTECTYGINTYMWVYNYPHAFDSSIEDSFSKYGVKYQNIEEIKARQYIQALAVEEKVKNVIKNGLCRDQ